VKVLLRADASSTQGTGHLSRCLVLAEKYKSRGDQVAISGNFSGISWINQRIKNLEIDVHESRESEINFTFIESFNPSLVILDSYLFHPEATKEIFEKYKTMAIADSATSEYWAHFYLNQNLGQASIPQDSPVGNRGIYLTGEKYALIRSDIKKARDVYNFNSARSNRLFVILGGANLGEYSNIEEFLLELSSKFSITLVGNSDNFSEKSRTRLLAKKEIAFIGYSPTIAWEILNSDVVLSAAGSTVLELLCIGVPSAFFPVAKNQEPIVEAIMSMEIGKVMFTKLGDAFGLRNFEQIVELFENTELRRHFTTKARGLVDGKGVDRIVEFIDNNLH
jgi:spore coat polysaccharide biosynthesis predicted glycosyltransferase SpsG